MSWRSKWQNFRKRSWNDIRASWLVNMPTFPDLGSPPDPGLENLTPLQSVTLPQHNGRFADVHGLRVNILWEAVFLFHKCAHTSLASQRVGQQGMHSWSLFNAYHSAYLGAKGLMALLGVSLPKIAGNQVAIDLFPEPTTRKRGPIAVVPEFQEFLIVRLAALVDQRYLWEAFLRVLNMTDTKCWDMASRQKLLELDFEKITPPRNRFLYRADYWPLPDLITDGVVSEFDKLFGTELDVDEEGFLLRLCFTVYYLFDQLMRDLANYSSVIKQQVEGSRMFASAGSSVVNCYSSFVSQIEKTPPS